MPSELLVKTPNSAWPTELAGRPLISVMTSPATMPAAAASVFGITGQKHEIGRHAPIDPPAATETHWDGRGDS